MLFLHGHGTNYSRLIRSGVFHVSYHPCIWCVYKYILSNRKWSQGMIAQACHTFPLAHQPYSPRRIALGSRALWSINGSSHICIRINDTWKVEYMNATHVGFNTPSIGGCNTYGSTAIGKINLQAHV